MMRYTLFICFLFSVVLSYAQITNDGTGARAIGLANATATSTDLWAVHNNIAGLAEFSGTQAGVAVQNQFGMEGFNRISLTAVHQTDFATAGLSVKRFGDNVYNETVIGIGAAHTIDFVSLGFKANVLQVNISEIGTKQAIALEFGGLIHLNDELTVGANIYNFNQAKLATFNDERFSTVLKAGISYQPNEALQLTLETEKDMEYKHNVKVGVEYFVIPKLAVRTGFSTLTNSTCFGVGLRLTKIDVDYGVAMHTQLGFTNAITINYRIKSSSSTEITPEN